MVLVVLGVAGLGSEGYPLSMPLMLIVLALVVLWMRPARAVARVRQARRADCVRRRHSVLGRPQVQVWRRRRADCVERHRSMAGRLEMGRVDLVGRPCLVVLCVDRQG